MKEFEMFKEKKKGKKRKESTFIKSVGENVKIERSELTKERNLDIFRVLHFMIEGNSFHFLPLEVDYSD
jgi:hypothetical protein